MQVCKLTTCTTSTTVSPCSSALQHSSSPSRGTCSIFGSLHRSYLPVVWVLGQAQKGVAQAQVQEVWEASVLRSLRAHGTSTRLPWSTTACTVRSSRSARSTSPPTHSSAAQPCSCPTEPPPHHPSIHPTEVWAPAQLVWVVWAQAQLVSVVWVAWAESGPHHQWSRQARCRSSQQCHPRPTQQAQRGTRACGHRTAVARRA